MKGTVILNLSVLSTVNRINFSFTSVKVCLVHCGYNSVFGYCLIHRRGSVFTHHNHVKIFHTLKQIFTVLSNVPFMS